MARESDILTSNTAYYVSPFDTADDTYCSDAGSLGGGILSMSPGSQNRYYSDTEYLDGMYSVGLASIRQTSEPETCRASLTVDNCTFVDWANALQVGAARDSTEPSPDYYHASYVDILDSSIKNGEREAPTVHPLYGTDGTAAMTVATRPEFMQAIKVVGTQFGNLYKPAILMDDGGSDSYNTQVKVVDTEFINVTVADWLASSGFSGALGSIMWNVGNDSSTARLTDETSSLLLDNVTIDAASDGVVAHTYGGNLDMSFKNTEAPVWEFATMSFVADSVYYKVESDSSTLANGMAELGNTSGGSTPVVKGWELATNAAVGSVESLSMYCGPNPLDCVCDGAFYEGQVVIKTDAGGPGEGSVGTVLGGRSDIGTLLVSWDEPSVKEWSGHALCTVDCGGDLCESTMDMNWYVSCASAKAYDGDTTDATEDLATK